MTLIPSFAFLLCITLIAAPVHAHAQTFKWLSTFGGTRPDDARGVVQTLDGGFILVGTGGPNPEPPRILSPGYIVKADSAGELVWQTQIAPSPYLLFQSVMAAGDDDYAIVGQTSATTTTGLDLFFMRIAGNGTPSKSMAIGTIREENIRSGIRTRDGSFAAVADADSLIIVNLLDGDGRLEWRKLYGDGASNVAASIQQTPDGGFIIAGSRARGSSGAGGSDIMLLRLDSAGDSLWMRHLPLDVPAYGRGILNAPGDGFIVLGELPDSGAPFYIAGTDAEGNVRWSERRGRAGAQFGAFTMLGDSSILIAGGQSNRPYVLAVDPSGRELWDDVVLDADCDCKANAIAGTSDGGYILAGTKTGDSIRSTDAFLLRLGRWVASAPGNPDSPTNEAPPAAVWLSRADATHEP